MNLENVNCYNCRSAERTPYDSENGYTLVKCSGCGLIYLSPRPVAEEITSASKTGQHRGDVTINVTNSFDRSAVERYRKILNEFFPDKWASRQNVSWLDIGCGHGELLVALQEHAPGKVTVRGCEPNQHKVASAKSRGLDVDFFDLSTHDGKYDYIALLNVFSHLPNPVESLTDWKRLLKPGGSLFMETGHSAHLSPKDHHKPYYLPDHLSFGNQKIVSDILKRIGLQPVKTSIYRHIVFPAFKPVRAAKEAVKRLLGRPNRFKDYCPPQPNRDMFVLASSGNN